MEIPVRDVVNGYVDNQEEGVVGFGGRLNIRPPYQREFIYKDKQRDAVVETVKKEFPLNVMYWVKNQDGTFEVLDGQQRTLSICQYIDGGYSLNFQFFHNLTEDEKEQILNYKLMVYFCEGTDKEKLDWFKTINIAGEQLTAQELRNAVYAGPWLTDAKRRFSKNQCAAYKLANMYMKGSPIRQDYLETVIKWISGNNIEDYMSENQHKQNANALWLYFLKVIQWVEATFTKQRKEMKGLDFGALYNEFGDKEFDTEELEAEITRLLQDEDVTKKPGIYPYVLTRNEKFLSIRAFSPNQKREAYERQGGICPRCTAPNNHYELNEMEADHITPWSQGGRTTADNCQMLCKRHNREKSNT